MSNQPRRLSEVVDVPTAPQGSNDGRWFLLEHQLYQARVSLYQVRLLCEQIGDLPENDEEWELARSVLEIITPVYTRLLGARSSVLALLAGTEVAERVRRMEDG